MDYAKRAAELVQCETVGEWCRAVINHQFVLDSDGVAPADVMWPARAWLAAELQAAHDAGVASMADKLRAAEDEIERLKARARLLHEECVGCGAALMDPDGPPYCEDTCAPTIEEAEEWEQRVDALKKEAGR